MWSEKELAEETEKFAISKYPAVWQMSFFFP